MQPKFPLIQFYKSEAVNVVSEPFALMQSNVLSLLIQQPEDETFYDDNLNVWKSEFKAINYELTFFRKLLAKTIYNPVVETQRSWIKVSTYRLADLKVKLQATLNEKEFSEGLDTVFIKNKIGFALSFNDLVQIILKDVLDPLQEKWRMEDSEESKGG
jgi:hypothetical protein